MKLIGRKKQKDGAKNQVAHLDLLISYIRDKYASLSEQINDLLQHGEITYDLLWFLFKPNEIVYTTCDGTGKPRCLRFGIGEEKSTLFGPVFNLGCQYLDSDGEKVGFASIDLNIPKFTGVKRIASLPCFPLQYHPQKGQVTAELIACGKKFYSLRGSHHCHCKGKAFVMQDDVKVKRNIDSRVMIDAAFFRRMKPNYQQPKIDTDRNMMQGFEEISFLDLFPDINPRDHGWDREHSPVFNTSETLAASVGGSSGVRPVEHCDHLPSPTRIASNEDLANDEYLICSPTVPGFCLSDKFWGEIER